ncbi:MAG: carboxypeptidase-like regulatory domain-containing protein, partial [Ginsengibacter sp.]
MKKLALLLSLCVSILLSNSCKSQTGKWKIVGQIKNQKDTVLFAASVFISNSTKGSITDSSGNFFLTGLSNGNYNLIVSSIGYETQIYPINIDNKNDSVLFVMKENEKELEDVVIDLKNGNRNNQLKVFRKAFLGKDKNAKETQILNEDILKLHTTGEGKITAH